MPTSHHRRFVGESAPTSAIADRIRREQRERESNPYAERDARIARRERFEAAAADPRNQVEPTPELIRDRVRRTALVPAIISVPCAEHDAQPGEYCYRTARGVCAARIIVRAALR